MAKFITLLLLSINFLSLIGGSVRAQEDSGVQAESGVDYGTGSLDTGFDTEQFNGFEDGNLDQLSAEQEQMLQTIMVAWSGAIFVMAIISLICIIYFALSLSGSLKLMPEANRPFPSFVPWLMLVPIINIVVLFLCFIMIPNSITNLQKSRGLAATGDNGLVLGIAGCIATLCLGPLAFILLFFAAKQIRKGAASL